MNANIRIESLLKIIICNKSIDIWKKKPMQRKKCSDSILKSMLSHRPAFSDAINLTKEKVKGISCFETSFNAHIDRTLRLRENLLYFDAQCSTTRLCLFGHTFLSSAIYQFDKLSNRHITSRTQ